MEAVTEGHDGPVGAPRVSGVTVVHARFRSPGDNTTNGFRFDDLRLLFGHVRRLAEP